MAVLKSAHPKVQYIDYPLTIINKNPRNGGSTKESLSSSEQYKQQVKANHEALEINPDNMFWPPYNPLAKDGQKEIDVIYTRKIVSVAVMSMDEAKELYINLGGRSTVQSTKNYSDLAKSSLEAYTLAKGLGGLGVKARTQNINGKDWIIIKDFRRHQQTIMKGTKWGANNPKVVKLGLGINDLKGSMRYVKMYAGIEIAFAVAINAADYIMRDEATLSEFVGNSAADIVKGVLTLGSAALFTATVVPATVGVLATGAIFAIASFAIGASLDYVDSLNGYTDSITNAIEGYFQ